jgi:ribosomal protein S11
MRHSENTKTSSLSYICITTTLNNTILNVTDMAGNTLLWASAGQCWL